MLADGEMHPAFIQKSAHHKRWESSALYIDSSLSKALKANNLLSDNDLSEGWGSRYSGNPKSLSRFLPERFIKQLPPQAEVSLERGNSENSTTSSGSSGSSLQEDSYIWKRSHSSGQDSVCDGRVKFRRTVITRGAATAPAPSDPNLNLAALDALQKSGAIKVIYPRSWQGNLVNSQPSPSKYSEN